MIFFKLLKIKKRTYLDYASSTPIDTKMLKMVPFLNKMSLFANPSALHKEGLFARGIINQSRERIAKILDIQNDEILFTSSATESNNLAINGLIKNFLAKGIKPNEIIIFTSDLEHSSISEIFKKLKDSGIQINILKSENGIINPKDISVSENIKVVIVSVIYVNNEIGTVQPINEISKRIRKLNKENPEIKFIFHTDASQASGHFSLRIPSLGVDMMTLGSTKLYCQRGIGFLYKKRNLLIDPIFYGGGQENNLRPSTESTSLIYDFSYALKYSQDIKEKETKRIAEIKEYFESEIKNNFPKLSIVAEKSNRSPHISFIAIPNFDSELMVLELDARGVAVSSKSACKNEEDKELDIIKNIYGKDWGGIRFSFGRLTNKKDIKKTIKELNSVLKKYSRI